MDLIVGSAGNADAAGGRQAFQAGGDIDALAEQIGAVHHDVAKVDADAEIHSARGFQAVVAAG